jgi:signal transduction histidine kinase
MNWLLGLILGISAANVWGEETQLSVLTNAMQVFNLGVEGARRAPHPVRFKAVVTYPVIRRPWFYAQDETGGILVLYTNKIPQPQAGQLVEIHGTAGPGAKAAHVFSAGFTVVGAAPLPEPHRADVARLVAGDDFGQWVSLEGRVVDLFLYPGQLSLLLAAGDYHFVVNFLLTQPLEMPLHWLGATVEVRGVCWTEARSDAMAFRLHSPGTNTIRFLRPGSDLFAAPLRTAKSLRDSRSGPDERVRVTGTITFIIPEHCVFLQDDSGAVKAFPAKRITERQYLIGVNGDTLITNLATLSDLSAYTVDRPFAVPLRPGDRIEVAGTPVPSRLGASLTDVEYRRLGAGGPIAPVVTSAAELASGRREGELVTVRARLLDRETRQVGANLQDLLVLREGGDTIQVTFNSKRTNAVPSLPRNSLLQATGICVSEAGEWKAIRGTRIFLRSAADIQVLGQPPAWESWHAGRVLLIASALGVGALAWIWFLGRRVAARTAELACANQRLQSEVDERKRAQADLAHALDAEKELSQLKSRFVSMVSHEFRTPLGVILASADLLSDYLDTLTPEERTEQITDIKQSTHHMAGLMEDVLVLGRVESGKIHFHPLLLDVPEFCRRLIDEILSATNRQCPIRFTEQGVAAPARGDETLLRHIFHNLLSNGVKYSPPGQPVQFRVERDGDNAVFTVIDEGIGIPSEDQKHIFDAFYRGKNVAQRAGSGLGLVIVKRCVDLHGGTIQIESVEGQGTTVTIRLPLFHS